jgi:hypothetical protein
MHTCIPRRYECLSDVPCARTVCYRISCAIIVNIFRVGRFGIIIVVVVHCCDDRFFGSLGMMGLKDLCMCMYMGI